MAHAIVLAISLVNNGRTCLGARMWMLQLRFISVIRTLKVSWKSMVTPRIRSLVTSGTDDGDTMIPEDWSNLATCCRIPVTIGSVLVELRCNLFSRCHPVTQWSVIVSSTHRFIPTFKSSPPSVKLSVHHRPWPLISLVRYTLFYLFMYLQQLNKGVIIHMYRQKIQILPTAMGSKHLKTYQCRSTITQLSFQIIIQSYKLHKE